jgi:hypothetical protein
MTHPSGRFHRCTLLYPRVTLQGSAASRLWLARRMTGMLAGVLPGRRIRVVADFAYAGGELKRLSAAVTWTIRLRKDAALYGPPLGSSVRRRMDLYMPASSMSRRRAAGF